MPHGGLDILVVASGMNDVSPITDMSPERFRAVMLANVDGAWLIARAAGARMIEQGRGQGRLHLLGARQARAPGRLFGYCTSKSAIDGMTKALGCEWGKYGITVNALAPTVFRSPLTAGCSRTTSSARSVRAGFLARVPIGRLGEPKTSPARCCSCARARRTSTPGTSSTQTVVTRRGEHESAIGCGRRARRWIDGSRASPRCSRWRGTACACSSRMRSRDIAPRALPRIGGSRR